MVLINNIELQEFNTLAPLLTGIIRVPAAPGYIYNIIHDMIKSPKAGNNVTITNGVHVSAGDPNGRYHFNIRITYGGNPGLMHHVYVVPVSQSFDGIREDPVTGSVTLGCIQALVWRITDVTTI